MIRAFVAAGFVAGLALAAFPGSPFGGGSPPSSSSSSTTLAGIEADGGAVAVIYPFVTDAGAQFLNGQVEFSGNANSPTQRAGVTLGVGTGGFPGIWFLSAGTTPDTTNYSILNAGNTILNHSSSVLLRVANATNFGCDGTTCTSTKPLAIGATGTSISTSYAAASTIDFAATTNTTTDSTAITVTGAAVGDTCTVGVPVAAQVTGATFTCFVTATNNVKIRFTAVGTSIDPASGSFNVRTFDP